MIIDETSGLVKEARQQPSPNCDLRPDETDIALVVIHGISLPPAEFGGDYIDQLFCNQLNPDEHPYFKEVADLKVSSHLLIRRDGEIVQYVPLQKRAWHAGFSSYENREKCNDFSIGIELEGDDDIEYSDEQYQALSSVLNGLFEAYPKLNKEKLVGHCDIAPGRKTDPGKAFDWSRLRQFLSAKPST